MKKLLLIVFIFSFFNSFSQEKPDSTVQLNSVKLDLLPLYYVFFDNRVQIRAGLEFERYILKKSSLSCYLDLGLYDKYKFIKYYNLFNENEGLYSIQQDITIKGFHLLPGYNYYFYRSKKKDTHKAFVGCMLDFGYYQKGIAYYNSLTRESYTDTYNQKKLGIGLSLGVKNNFGKHFFAELKTSLFTKIFNYISLDEKPLMKSLDSQWTSTDYNFWWITNIKIGYAF